MPSPLSLDLRTRIVAAYEAGEGTQKEIAARYNVGSATVSRLVQAKRKQGHLRPGMSTGRKSVLDQLDQKVLLDALAIAPDLTLAQLIDVLVRERGKLVGDSTISRLLIRLGWTRKKNSQGQRTGPGTDR